MFTTMCAKELQTCDNLIVKDNYFIIEKFDKFSFSGILRGCLSHLNETCRVSQKSTQVSNKKSLS